MTESKETFKELLKNAIGDNKKGAFAEKVGITRVYLQNLLSGKNSSPSADLICRIVRCSDGRVSIKEMFDACGLETPSFTPTQSRLYMGFSDWCRANANDVIECYQDINEKKIFVFDAREFKAYFRTYFSASACKITIGEPEGYEGVNVADVIIPVTYRWISIIEKKMQEMKTLLLAIQSKSGKYIVTKATCAPIDMAEASPDLKAELTDIDDCIDDGSSLFEAPYVYSTTNITSEDNWSPVEQKLINVLYGRDPDNVLSLYGFGFYLKDEPDGVIDFVKNHKEAFLKGNHYNDFSDEDAEKFTEDVIEKGGDAEEFFSRFGVSNLTGYPQIIAGIIENETGLKFGGDTHQNEDDRNRNCVYIDHDEVTKIENEREGDRVEVMRAVRQEIIDALTPYAKELNIRTLETCFFYLPVNAGDTFWRECKID